MRLLPKIASGTLTVRFGPFVDSTDGYTPETALTIAASSVRLSKNNAAFGAKNEASSATHDENGWYAVVFNTTDLGTLGELIVAFNITGALPVWERFMVVPQGVYDLYGTADSGIVAMKQLKLYNDEGLLPLDIDSGPTCGGNAMRIRAQRASQKAIEVSIPAGGYGLDFVSTGSVGVPIRVTAGASGGSAIVLAAPGSGASRAIDMSASGDATVKMVNNGGYPAIDILGSSTGIKIRGSVSAIDIAPINTNGCGIVFTNPGGTGAAIRMSGGMYGIDMQPDEGGGAGINIYGDEPGMSGIKVNMVNVSSYAANLSANGKGVYVRATDAIDILGTAIGCVLEGGTGFGLRVTGNGAGNGALELIGAGGAVGHKVTGGIDVSGAVSLNNGLSLVASTIPLYIGNSGGGDGIKVDCTGSGNALVLSAAGTGKSIDAKEIGTPIDLADGASLAAMLTALAGKTANAASYDRTTDSNEALADAMSGSGLTAQAVRDAMMLAPSAGVPAAGSVDLALDDIQAKTDNLPATPADETTVVAVGSAVLGVATDVGVVDGKVDTLLVDVATVDGKADTIIVDVGALNDLSAADVETAVETKLDEVVSEPSVGVPPTTTGLRAMVAYLFQPFRNKGAMSKTSGDKTFHNSSGVALFKKHTSDDGTTYTEDGASAV